MNILFYPRYPNFNFLTLYEAGRTYDNNVLTYIGAGGGLYQSGRGLKYVLWAVFGHLEGKVCTSEKGFGGDLCTYLRVNPFLLYSPCSIVDAVGGDGGT